MIDHSVVQPDGAYSGAPAGGWRRAENIECVGCRLIVNADDFGGSDGANQAIVRAHGAGAVSSCSLMVAEPATHEAVERARDHPSLAVGLHLTLLRGRAALPQPAVAALCGPDGRFGEDPARTGLRYFFSPRARRQVRLEVDAQFERFAATGLSISHVDAHLHFHLHPVILAAVLETAPRFGCRHIRVPLDSWRIHRVLEPRDAWRQVALAAVFAAGCRRVRARARVAGLAGPGYCFGLFRTGRLDAEYLAKLARALPDGVHELHCHPNCATAGGRRELDALLSPAFREALSARGATLATYADLDQERTCLAC
jgi:hopanoid biosynthesis associated protein HpnK